MTSTVGLTPNVMVSEKQLLFDRYLIDYIK
jgi:hypothetical protein